MKTILLTNTYSGRPLEIIRGALPGGFELLLSPGGSPEELYALAPEADYILAGGRFAISEDFIGRAARLKMIQRSGVGLDSIDLDSLRRHGIPLYVNPGVNARSVAEHALLLMLASLRRLPQIDRNTKNGIWKKQEQGVCTSELSGKTVGLIGMGHIAKTLAGLLRPFNVRILYYDVSPADADFEKEYSLEFTDLDRLLKESDIISLHCALTEQTRGLINAAALDKTKPGVIIVNTARGGLIDTAALAAALGSGQVSFAALDVHEEEPLPADYKLLDYDNVILTPHIGGVTADSFGAMMRDAFRNIKCFDEGKLEEIKQYRYL